MAKEISVAELAEELNVSKQLIYYHSKKISKEYQIRNQSNQLVFSQEQVDMIKGFIGNKQDDILKGGLKYDSDSKENDSNDFKTNLDTDAYKDLVQAKDEQIQILKDVLKKKDERIDTLLTQVSYSQRLIDQQQQLDQYRNKLYLSDNKEEQENQKKWWEFWK